MKVLILVVPANEAREGRLEKLYRLRTVYEDGWVKERLDTMDDGLVWEEARRREQEERDAGNEVEVRRATAREAARNP